MIKAREKKWMVYAKKADFKKLSQKYGMDQVIMRILRNRDLNTDEEINLYLNGGIGDIYDSSLLPDAKKAIDILKENIDAGNRIRVVGDYDIDGVCATYILSSVLKKISANADYAIPDRVKDGYGINRSIVDKAIKDGVNLIITCDNGIAAIEELSYAALHGIKVIVTDHHDVRLDESGNEQIPVADAVVNAKLKKSQYPCSDICGAVTAWKLSELLLLEYGFPFEDWLAFSEFAAIATVGDVMKLVGENRIIVREGLRRINEGSFNLGLRKLIEKCDINGKKINTYHIGFIIGPCINAGGRLESAELAMKLFMSETEAEAEHYAMKLKLLNDERKAMTERGMADAEKIVEETEYERQVLVIYLPELHESLAGIVAGRVKEKYGKPAFVITDSEDGCKGSGRSIEAYHMFDALCKVSDLLEKFGGHPMAAGLSLKKENVNKLRERLNEEAGLKEEDFVQKLMIDCAMPIGYISAKLIEELDVLEPFGPGNEKPVFAVKNVLLTDKRILGKNRNVLKLIVRDESGSSVQGVFFGTAEEMNDILVNDSPASILYYPQINEFNGRRTLQIVLNEVRFN